MIRNGRDKSVFVGYLFEELAAHFFGGEITDRSPYVGNSREVGKVDITDTKNKRLIEVKSSYYKDRFILLERQFKKQQNLTNGNYGQLNFFLDDFSLYQMFFSYKIKRLHSYSNDDYLRKVIKESIDSLLITSFDVVEKMFEFYSVKDNRKWPSHIEFKREHVSMFLSNPQEALAMFGMDSEDYSIRRGSLSNQIVNKFPAVSIVNKKYENSQFLL